MSMQATVTFTLATEAYDGPVVPEANSPQSAPTNGAAPESPDAQTGEIQNADPNANNNAGTGTNQQGDDGGGSLLSSGALPLIVLGILLLMFIFMTSSQRKERKKHQQMLASLRKGDKVQTVGGIIGTLVEIRDDEVLVKVDENANTRMRFARSAIKSVLESKAEDTKEA